MSVRAAGRALFVVIVLAAAFDATLPFLLFAGRGHSCSCPIKGPCCEGAVCPMDAARREADGLSFRSCGTDSTQVAMPNFLRWMLLLPLAASAEPVMSVAGLPGGVPYTLPVGVSPVPEHPPRVSFLPIA
jgi:hypothetical protein